MTAGWARSGRCCRRAGIFRYVGGRCGQVVDRLFDLNNKTMRRMSSDLATMFLGNQSSGVNFLRQRIKSWMILRQRRFPKDRAHLKNFSTISRSDLVKGYRPQWGIVSYFGRFFLGGSRPCRQRSGGYHKFSSKGTPFSRFRAKKYPIRTLSAPSPA